MVADDIHDRYETDNIMEQEVPRPRTILKQLNSMLTMKDTLAVYPELKAEVTCRTERLKETLAAIKKVHPYEEPVINVIPLYMTGMDADEKES